jgi:hypothetical protein
VLAQAAHGNDGCIRGVKQAILDKVGGPVTLHCVALHVAEP